MVLVSHRRVSRGSHARFAASPFLAAAAVFVWTLLRLPPHARPFAVPAWVRPSCSRQTCSKPRSPLRRRAGEGALSEVAVKPTEAEDPLVEWVRENGGFISTKVNITRLPARGVALQAGDDMAENELIMAIPGTLDLQESAKAAASQGHWLMQAMSQSPRLRELRFAAHMALQLQTLRERENQATDDFFDPFWRSIDLEASADVPFFESHGDWQMLRGSPEYLRPSKYEDLRVLAGALTEFMEEISPGMILNETLLIMATHFLEAHAFTDDARILPVAINMNHDIDSRRNVLWHWMQENETLMVHAHRSIPRGEELTICYGLRSNEQLFSLYGFTLPPASEPMLTCGLVSVEEFLPKEVLDEDVDFGVRLTTLPFALGKELTPTEDIVAYAMGRLEPLIGCLRRAAAHGADPLKLLEEIVTTWRHRCHDDEVIAPHVQQLVDNRKLLPCSWVWWARNPAAGVDDVEDLSGAEALGGKFRSDVVRYKMSRYLCLLAFEEAIRLQRADPELEAMDALPQACLLQPLLQAVKFYSKPESA